MKLELNPEQKNNLEELMSKIEIPNEDIDKWEVTIRGYSWDDKSWIKVKKYSDRSFLIEGLPTAIIAYYLARKQFSNYLIYKVYRYDSSLILNGALDRFVADCVMITRGEVAYDVGLIPEEKAEEIVRDFLTGKSFPGIYPGGYFDKKFVKEALNELFPKLENVKVKK